MSSKNAMVLEWPQFIDFLVRYSALPLRRDTSTCLSTTYVRLVLAKIKYLKSAAMLFFKLNTNSYGIGLSNKQIFITLDQGAAKV